MKFTSRLFPAIILASALAGTGLQAQTLVSLGNFGGSDTEAWSINDSGQIAGYSATSQGTFQAFLYSGGTLHNLGSLSGSHSFGFGVNNSGQVVGMSFLTASTYGAFLYSGGAMSRLGGLPGLDDEAESINDAGKIVGVTYSDSSHYSAFLSSNGSTSILGPLPGFTNSYAAGINNADQIVGESTLLGNGDGKHAFLYANGAMKDLGTLTGSGYSYASSINDQGQITGGSNVGSHIQAILYSNGNMTSLGTLAGDTDSDGRAINNAGQVVGVSFANGSPTDPFLYSAESGMVNLNTVYADFLVSGTGPKSGFTHLDLAQDINSSGQIVGYGTYWTGSTSRTEAFLITPAVVPEPGTWAMLLGGVGLLVFFQVLRRRTSVSES